MGLSEIVDVQISRQTTAVTQAGFGTAMFIADVVPVAFTERIRTYTDAAGLLTDGFAISDNAYKFAQVYFGQEIKPQYLKIGREDAGDTDVADTLAKIRLVDDDFYAVAAYTHVKADILLLAAAVETLQKIYAAATEDADVLTVATTDVASALQLAAYDRTFIIWSADSEKFPEGAWLGLGLPQDPGSITWKFKTLVGILPDNHTPTQKTYAKGKNCNVYTTIGGVNITEEGVMASGEFIDVMHGVDFLTARIQENVYTSLVNLPKVPYTDQGVAIIESDVREILLLGIRQGILAADPQPTVTVPLVSEVSALDKANRYLPDVEFLATLAGAIHKTQIRGVVTV